MGSPHHVAGMFRGVTYNRFTTATIKEKMASKITALKSKIVERRGRVARLMEENKITSEALSDMLVQYMKDQDKGNNRVTYTTQNMGGMSPANSATPEVLIPAGVVSNIVTEKNLIEGETEEVKRMDLILRNLREYLPVVDEKTNTLAERPFIHTLTDEEIDYLGL